MNKSTRTSISSDVISKGFGLLQSFLAICLIVASMFFGIHQSNPQNSKYYGVTVIYLITLGEVIQWIVRQIVVVEGLMVSAERVL